MALHNNDTYSAGNRTKSDEKAGEILTAFILVLLSATAIALPVFMHVVYTPIALFLALFCAVLLARFLPDALFPVLIFATIFQNFFVAMVASNLAEGTDFSLARAYEFVLLGAAWGTVFLLYLFQHRGQNRALDRMIKITTLVFALIGLFFVVGLAQSPVTAFVYLRGIATPLMLFQIGLIIFATRHVKVTPALVLITGLVILFGYVELFFREEWMTWTGGNVFWDLVTNPKESFVQWQLDAERGGLVLKGFLDTVTVDLFNTPLLSDLEIRVERLLGPNFHPISYAYTVLFLMIFSLYRGAFFSAVLLFPLLIFTNAKGALIVFILVAFAWTLSRSLSVKIAFYGLCLLLCLYILLGIKVGLDIGDFHVLGFMGGLYQFLGNPFGHGIGLGGNLSTDFNTLDWPAYQAAGRTPVAIESAIGVMLYQMGVATLVYVGVCIWIAWKTVSLGNDTGISLHLAAGFALLCVLANGIFQEEALFSPVAFRLILGLNGVILGAAIRTGAYR